MIKQLTHLFTTSSRLVVCSFELNCRLLTMFANSIAVCVMYVKQFASEEWREASFHCANNTNFVYCIVKFYQHVVV